MQNKLIYILLFLLFAPNIPLSAGEILLVRKGNKWACIDTYGNAITPFIYDDAEPFNETQRAQVKKNEKWGYINKLGQLVIDCKYDKATPFNANMAVVQQNGKWGVINQHGKVEIPIRLDTIITGQYSDGIYNELLLGKLDGKFCGYYKNKQVLKPIYDSIEIGFRDEFIATKDGQYGLVDTLGQILIPFSEELIMGRWYSGHYKMKLGRKIRFLNLDTGENLTEDEYYKVFRFRNGYKVVSLSSCDVYENEKGERAFGKTFHTARRFSGGIAMVTDFDLSRHCIDTLGRVIFDVPKEMCVGSFENGFAKFYNESNYRLGGLINDKGEVLVEAKYKEISKRGDFVKLTVDSLISFYDIEKKTISKEYSKVGSRSYKTQISSVKRGDKYGFVDSAYIEIIAPIYDQGTDFIEGVSAVSKNGKWGYIDELGKTVIPFLFTEAHYFVDGLAVVKYKNKFGVIDKKNRARIPFEYDEMRRDSYYDVLEIIDIIDFVKPDRLYIER